MPKYRVNRDSGYPIDHDPLLGPKYRFGDEFESDAPEDARAAEQGYLVLVAAPPAANARARHREREEAAPLVSEAPPT